MTLFRTTALVALLYIFSTGTASLEAEEEHPWVGVANASVFAQRLLDHRDSHGWVDLRNSIFSDANFAYERRHPVAERLLYAFLWIDLMYGRESDYVAEWISKMEKANRLHANMPAEITYREGAIGDRLSDDFLQYFFSRGDLMKAAYNQRDPSDLLTEVFSILDRLYSKNRYLFIQYPELAFAIAYVHDVPPPPLWPHPQIGQDVLPRKLRSADDVFGYFTNPRNVKWFHSSIKRLALADAVFLVDLIATPEEADWVHAKVSQKPVDYEEVYTMIRYDSRRIQAGQYHWMYDDYSLSAIHKVGGICVDQAYFASQAGKIQGLPTIEFLGSGLDGRHAWFGFLTPDGKWEMDAGRYADQRFITGHGFNPQTWAFISDHEVSFLGSSYHRSQSYYKSQLHYHWARLYSAMDRVTLAEKAASDAVALEPRNAAAWSLLIDLRKRLNVPRSRIDSTYRSALSALRTYSDLEARFLSEFAEFLESTGRINSARLERSRITYKNKDTRSDLAIQNAVQLLRESMINDSRAAQMYVYRRILYQMGDQGGIQVLDELVIPFVNHLLVKGRTSDAKTAILEGERVLQPADGSQMSKDFQKVKSQVGL